LIRDDCHTDLRLFSAATIVGLSVLSTYAAAHFFVGQKKRRTL
jgi:hypothetical protein